MKKIFFFIFVSTCLAGSTLYAGSLDYLTNQSAKIAITFHRAAATDTSADIANYNPAGTAFFPEGLYLDLSSQMLFKLYRAEANDSDPAKKKFEQNEPTWYLPNFYAVYNFGDIGPGRHAVYLQAGIVAGGGALNWKNGTVGTLAAYTNSFSSYFSEVEDHSFQAYSVYYGIGFGVAYSFFKNILAVSAGVRLVFPDRYLQLSAKSTGILSGLGPSISLDGKFSYSSFGITPVLGVDVKPIKGLTIGLRYEAETQLSFKYKKEYLRVDPEIINIVIDINVHDAVEEGLASGGVYDGNKFNYNLPHIISFGAKYDVSFLLKGLSLMASATLYLLPVTDLGQYYDSAVDTPDPIGDVNEFFGVGWETGIGASYQVLPELKVGCGFMYNTLGTKKKYFTSSYTMLTCSANPPLDSTTIGIGGTWLFKSIGLDVTLAFTWTHYIPFEGALSTAVGNFDIEYRKNVFNIATGISYQLHFGKEAQKKQLRRI